MLSFNLLGGTTGKYIKVDVLSHNEWEYHNCSHL